MTHRVALFVAENGGHLDQMIRLEPRFRPAFDHATYVTSREGDPGEVLAGRDVHFVPRVPPRAFSRAVRAYLPALRLIRRQGVTDVISTGSAIAVPYLVAARTLGLRAHYIESATRTEGPSLTGRILMRTPGVHLYTQYRHLADDTWTYRGSVFDGFSVHNGIPAGQQPARVVVTLGTMSQFPFGRAVQAVRRVLSQVAGPQTQVLWQIGDLPAADLPGEVCSTVPAARLHAAIAEADLVVAHAGTGSSLRILESGRVPLLVPRSRANGEHVDDHQVLLARELAGRGLAVAADPEQLSVDHVRTVLSRRVVRNAEEPDLPLMTT